MKMNSLLAALGKKKEGGGGGMMEKKWKNNPGKTVNGNHHVYRRSSGLSERFEAL